MLQCFLSKISAVIKRTPYFADGVQDEILTNLARIADLKVISRTSVMQYKTGLQRNPARDRSATGRGAFTRRQRPARCQQDVRVNAQLIDARTDAHLWAQTYDRDLADVFAIQSEIAKAIADQLQARLSPNEKRRLKKRPPATWPPSIFTPGPRLFSSRQVSALILSKTCGRRLSFLTRQFSETRHFSRPIASCSMLTRCFIQWASITLLGGWLLRKPLFKRRPGCGPMPEKHTWHGRNISISVPAITTAALAELENARRSLPNDPRIFELIGFILRRRGQQEEGLRNLEKAVELDPRSYDMMQQIALSYEQLRSLSRGGCHSGSRLDHYSERCRH